MHVATFSELVEDFVNKVREASGYNDIAFELFCNARDIEYTFKRRTAESLKRDSISMRNLNGDFISERTVKSAVENAEGTSCH